MPSSYFFATLNISLDSYRRLRFSSLNSWTVTYRDRISFSSKTFCTVFLVIPEASDNCFASCTLFICKCPKTAIYNVSSSLILFCYKTLNFAENETICTRSWIEQSILTFKWQSSKILIETNRFVLCTFGLKNLRVASTEIFQTVCSWFESCL